MQDFIPVLGFVLAYVIARVVGYHEEAMYIATAALMIVSVGQIIWMKLTHRDIQKRHWLTVLVILILGGLTLAVHNDMYIKFKPTILNIVIAAVFIGSEYVGKHNLTRRMLGSVFVMPKPLWRRLNWAWVIFFLAEGALNAYVALNYSNDIYVTFKFWGLMVLTFLFLLAQFVILRKYVKHEEKAK